jgi:hypothetical protein
VRKKYEVLVSRYNYKKGKSDVWSEYVIAWNKMDAVRSVREYLKEIYSYNNRPRVHWDNDREGEVFEYIEPNFIDSEEYNFT